MSKPPHILPGMGKIETLQNGITDSQLRYNSFVHVITRNEIENFELSRVQNVAAPYC